MKRTVFTLLLAPALLAGTAGAQNLLSNPSFEDAGGSLNGWTNSGPYNFGMNGTFPDPGSGEDGPNYASLSVGGGGSGSLYQELTVTPGNTYALEVYVYLGGSGSGTSITGSLRWYDGAWPGSWGATTQLVGETSVEGSWSPAGWRLMTAQVVPSGTTLTYCIALTMSGWASGGHFDSASLVDLGQLDTPTPTFTPTPTLTPTLPPFSVAQRLATAPTLDGELSPGEWGAPTDTIDPVANDVYEGVIDDAADMSAVFYTGYDDEFLYVAVEVTDDVNVNDSGAQIWHDDSIEVFVDGDFSRSPAARTAQEYLTGGQFSGDSIYDNVGGENGGKTFGPGPGDDWYAVSQLTAAGWTAEIRIRLSSIGDPQPGDLIGFNIGLNDDDTGGLRDGAMIWTNLTGSLQPYQEEDAWGALLLQKASSAHVDPRVWNVYE